MKKRIYLLSLVAMTTLAFAQTYDNDPWSETFRGYNQTLKGFPDYNANYWEYTFINEGDPMGLKVTGIKPNVRFFSYNVYNDSLQRANCVDSTLLTCIQDRDLVTKETTNYSFFVLPEGSEAPDGATVVWYNATDKRVCLMLRYYLAKNAQGEKDDFGGVAMPTIQGYNPKTKQLCDLPQRGRCDVRDMKMQLPDSFSYAAQQTFMLAPNNANTYPNVTTSYIYGVNQLTDSTVIVINVKTPSFAKDMYDSSADMRYWSIAFGALDSYSYGTIADEESIIDSKTGIATYVFADSNAVMYQQVKNACTQRGYNLLPYDRAAHGNSIMLFYRNMLVRDDYKYDFAKKLKTYNVSTQETPSQIEMMAYLANVQMGVYGPAGYNMPITHFLGGYETTYINGVRYAMDNLFHEDYEATGTVDTVPGQLSIAVGQQTVATQQAEVLLESISDTTVGFCLHNVLFDMPTQAGTQKITLGNICLHNAGYKLTGDSATFSYKGFTRVHSGNIQGIKETQWIGPALTLSLLSTTQKAVPVELNGKCNIANDIVQATLTLDFTQTQFQAPITLTFEAKVTGVENITESASSQVTKFVRDGQIVIQKGKRTYDLLGNIIQ